jgi:hypothetical protein
VHSAIVAPLIATALAAAAITGYGETTAQNNALLATPGLVLGASYAAIMARRGGADRSRMIAVAVVSVVVAAVLWFVVITVTVIAVCGTHGGCG